MKRELSISSNVDSLREVEKLVDEVSEECNLSSEKYGNVLIATLEATNNAILHGNKLNEKKNVDIKCYWSKKELKMTIIDQGNGFDYKNIPDPTAPENVEKINGRGIFLMVKLADKIVFNNEGRVVNLTFNLT
ncbi:MAG: ATP-binding protein [Candidatus Delongbacteria bacterium]|nr:ATP-binding protein [Candidatus Delongbacteria bacterium]